MNLTKKILIIIGIILIILGGIFYFNLKNLVSPDKQIEKQIEKQYKNEVKTSLKKPLNFNIFETSMKKVSEERYYELEKSLLNSDISEIQENFKNKTYTVEEVTTFFLKRIQKYDENKLNTIIELNPDAIEIAKSLDKELAKGNFKGNLFGIPVLLKDNIGTKDKMHNTAGAKALENSKCDKDAFIVNKLRKANAIILGKANLSEWANFMTTDSANGYSALGGQTHNPYGKFDTGGSSSGSAAAVAAGFAPISIGSETAGSIIYPSSQNSVVAIKPSLGLLSRDRIIPISEAQDTAGTISKNVKDAVALFNELVGYDSSDKDAEYAKEYDNVDYTKFLIKDGLKGMKVGIVVNDEVASKYRNEEKNLLNKAIEDLKSLGAEVKDVKIESNAFKINYMNVLFNGYKKGVQKYLETIGSTNIKNIENIIDFNKEDMENRAPYGQNIIEKAEKNTATQEAINKEIESNRKITGEAIDNTLKSNDVDVLISLSDCISKVYATAGYPAITVQAGYKSTGEPLGITIVSSKFQEDKLIKAAYSYEQGTQNRKDPEFEN